MSEVSIYDHYDRMREVADLHLKGHSPAEIVRKTGIKRAQVLDLIDEYKKVLKDGAHLKTLATETVLETKESYARIKAELWATIEEADNQDDLRTKTTALKSVADVEAKLVDMLQKAGLLSDQELGDQIAEQERILQDIKVLMQEVAVQYPETREFIMEGLARVFGEPIAVQA